MSAPASPILKIIAFIALATSFLATSFLATSLPFAQPVQTFTTYQRGGGQDFTYIYPTASGQQTLAIRLNLDDISRGSAEFKPWNEPEARQAATAAANKAAQALNTPAVTFSATAIPGGMALRASGTDPRLGQSGFLEGIQKTIHPTYQQALEEYARRHYYRTIPKAPNVTSIMPNHPAIAVRYTAAMGPVAKAIQEQVPGASASPRAFINAALNWLQTIPYDTLEDRTTSNGAGFQTPYGMMLGNLGDCDTKAVALAALIRNAYPSIPLGIVYVPDHAFLAVGLPQDKTDYALRTGHGTYILADATGPRLTPLGFIDERTRARVRTAQTEVLPVR